MRWDERAANGAHCQSPNTRCSQGIVLFEIGAWQVDHERVGRRNLVVISSPYFFVDSLHPAHHGKSNGVTCFSPCALYLGQPASPNRNQQPSFPDPG